MKQEKQKTRTKRTEYADYLNTERWNSIRQIVYSRAGNKCQVCGRSDLPLHAHHNTYEHKGDEEHHMEDLVCLCSECHALFHGHKRDEEIEHLKEESEKWYNMAHDVKECAIYFKNKMLEVNEQLNDATKQNRQLSRIANEADEANIYYLTRWSECYDMLQKVCGENLSEYIETPSYYLPSREEENVTETVPTYPLTADYPF